MTNFEAASRSGLNPEFFKDAMQVVVAVVFDDEAAFFRGMLE
jgi:hypothetical protein